jgi:transposase
LTPVWVPEAAHEALRDLVRARLAAKRDQLRARNRLSKFLLRHGRRAPEGTTAWSTKHLDWVKRQSFEQGAQQATLVDYLHEVQHEAERIVRLERSIDTAIETLPEKMRAVIEALQSLRGIAKISAVSIMAEVGELSRFEHARQLMGYSGAVSWEDSSGPRVHRGGTLLARQRDQSEDIKAMAWKAQHRLHARYAKLLAKGKAKQQVITAVGRELLGFIWAIGIAAERSHLDYSSRRTLQRAA